MQKRELMKTNFNLYSSTDTQVEESVDLLEEVLEDSHLVVYNDDVNTFDHVIDTLVKVCKHDTIQAEQCTYIIHYKGKCSVKSGERHKLESMCTAILDRGINAEIQ